MKSQAEEIRLRSRITFVRLHKGQGFVRLSANFYAINWKEGAPPWRTMSPERAIGAYSRTRTPARPFPGLCSRGAYSARATRSPPKNRPRLSREPLIRYELGRRPRELSPTSLVRANGARGDESNKATLLSLEVSARGSALFLISRAASEIRQTAFKSMARECRR